MFPASAFATSGTANIQIFNAVQNVTTTNSRLYISPQGSIKNFTTVSITGNNAVIWGALG